MTFRKLALTEYAGKNTIHIKVPNTQGIYTIWDWCSKSSRYLQRKEGLRYYGYKKVDGVQKTKCFETLKQVKAWRESPDLFADKPTGSEITFKGVKEKYFKAKESQLRISTLETYESVAKHLVFFDNLPVAQITPKTVDVWLSQLKSPSYLALQHRSRLSYRNELSMLKQILEYYAEYLCEGIYYHPIKRRHSADCVVDKQRLDLSKSKTTYKYLPSAEINQFLNWLEERANSNPNRLIFWLAAVFQLRSGNRIGETCAIDFRAIDFETGVVTISSTVLWSRKKDRPTVVSPLTKTGEPRVIYLTDQVLNALIRWRETCGRSSGLVFSYDGFQPITYRSVQHHYDMGLAEIGSQWRSTPHPPAQFFD